MFQHTMFWVILYPSADCCMYVYTVYICIYIHTVSFVVTLPIWANDPGRHNGNFLEESFLAFWSTHPNMTFSHLKQQSLLSFGTFFLLQATFTCEALWSSVKLQECLKVIVEIVMRSPASQEKCCFNASCCYHKVSTKFLCLRWSVSRSCVDSCHL